MRDHSGTITAKHHLAKLKNLYSLRARTYRAVHKFAYESEYWTEEQWRQYQWDRVSDLLRYVYRWVPYYNSVFTQMKITPDDIRNWKDFAGLPILTKDIIRENHDQMISMNPKAKKEAVFFSSSGSTGKPLSFYSSITVQATTQAYMDFLWSRIGYVPGTSRVVIRGIVGEKIIERTSYDTWNISTYGLTEDNLEQIICFLNDARPAYIHAYPSSLKSLVYLMMDNGLKLSYKPSGILLGSERYSTEDRALLESFLGCKSYSWLGLAEGTILAGECETNHNYHVLPGYSYVELIRPKEDDGIEGNMIIGTSFHNRVFPFIRYYGGDRASLTPDSCSCGRQYQILSNLVGRDQDYFVTKEGDVISLTAIYSAIHSDVLTRIESCQFIQKKPGVALVLLVPSLNFKECDMDNFIKELSLQAGNRISFSGSIVDELHKTPNGKIKLLLSDIVNS